MSISIRIFYYTGYGPARSYSEFTVRSCTVGKYKTFTQIGDGIGIKVREFAEVRLVSCSPEHFFPEEDMVPGSMSLVV